MPNSKQPEGLSTLSLREARPQGKSPLGELCASSESASGRENILQDCLSPAPCGRSSTQRAQRKKGTLSESPNGCFKHGGYTRAGHHMPEGLSTLSLREARPQGKSPLSGLCASSESASGREINLQKDFCQHANRKKKPNASPHQLLLEAKPRSASQRRNAYFPGHVAAALPAGSASPHRLVSLDIDTQARKSQPQPRT
jgi:hypothetical protein